jgi:predicted transposase YbfD/YdcC
MRWPKPSSCCPATFPPQAISVDKGHGRIETREIWCAPATPQTIGLAGVAQVIRIRRRVQEVRKGKITKESDLSAFGATSYYPRQAGPQQLLELVRDHWSIENGQHYRRDRTQDEDRCTVRDTVSARALSLFRSLAIFLFMTQAQSEGGKKSLPDFERHVERKPRGLIHRFTLDRHDE